MGEASSRVPRRYGCRQEPSCRCTPPRHRSPHGTAASLRFGEGSRRPLDPQEAEIRPVLVEAPEVLREHALHVGRAPTQRRPYGSSTGAVARRGILDLATREVFPDSTEDGSRPGTATRTGGANSRHSSAVRSPWSPARTAGHPSTPAAARTARRSGAGRQDRVCTGDVDIHRRVVDRQVATQGRFLVITVRRTRRGLPGEVKRRRDVHHSSTSGNHSSDSPSANFSCLDLPRAHPGSKVEHPQPAPWTLDFGYSAMSFL